MPRNPYQSPTADPSHQQHPIRRSVLSVRDLLQGIVNAVVMACLLFGSWFAVFRTVTFFMPTLPHAGSIAFGILFTGFTTRGITRHYNGKRIRGPLLVDCGSHPARWAFWQTSLISFFVGISTLGGYGPLHWTLAFPFIAMSAIAIWLSFERLSIHHHGIWIFESLIQWHEIKQYHWSANSLIIRRSGFPALLIRNRLPIPDDCVKKVADALKSNAIPSSAA